ncbi:hypothetical protein ABNP34_14770 [Glutamicibacter mishrai]|uniref:hypothetical protein n=1 Tax=Glutamicibacter mishrai TaxID=1775880 RepID=UPI001269637B
MSSEIHSIICTPCPSKPVRQSCRAEGWNYEIYCRLKRPSFPSGHSIFLWPDVFSPLSGTRQGNLLEPYICLPDSPLLHSNFIEEPAGSLHEDVGGLVNHVTINHLLQT